jgi:hypothetical protein
MPGTDNCIAPPAQVRTRAIRRAVMIGARQFVRGGVIALTLATGGRAIITAQETAALELPQVIRADVAHIRPVSLAMVVRESSGPLTKENIHNQITEVVGEYVRQGFDFSLGGFGPKPVVVLYEDPTGKRDVRMAVGISVPPRGQPSAGKSAGAEFKAPLKYVPMQMNKVIRHVHIGPHDQLADAFHAIEKELQASKRRPVWPVVLQILDDPNRVDAKELRTVMNIQVE